MDLDVAVATDAARSQAIHEATPRRHPAFNQPLFDLGVVESPAFSGVWCPRDEIGTAKEGIDEVFLDNAEAYYGKYQSFSYWKYLIEDADRRLNFGPVSHVVEFGCGFGNSTLPILEVFQNASVVASDLSPNLVAILRRLVEARGFQARCIPVAMDAHRDVMNHGWADLVFGSAILHHLVEPERFVRQALAVLRPGGYAVFFEPFEAGYAMLCLVCDEIVKAAKTREFNHPVVAWAASMRPALAPQLRRTAHPGWQDCNDKWAFPRAVLQDIADAVDAELIIYPITAVVDPFKAHLAYMMTTYGGFAVSDLPDWAWEIVRYYDQDIFSPDMMRDFALEGGVAFRRRSA